MQSGDTISAQADDAGAYEALCNRMRQLGSVLVAYSGGVDSTLLLRAALDALGNERVRAVLAVSETLPRTEHDQARARAAEMGVTLTEIASTEFADPQFRANDPQRCYHCRVQLFRQLAELARQWRLATVVCGVNADDPQDYRPGMRAAAEFEVAAPLRDVGLNKARIRALSRHLDLPTWNKPAQPCLATRLAYGLEITPERLEQVERGEAFLRALGFEPVRLRHHDNLARIEVAPDQLAALLADDTRRQVVAFVRDLGFTYVSLDLQGFRSGSGNEVL